LKFAFVMNSRSFLIIALAAGLLCGCQHSAAPGAKLVGKPIEIRFDAIDGTHVDTTQMRGKVVLVDFWATWCPPCVKEVPVVKAAYEKLHGRGFEVVGISMDDKKEDLLSFVANQKLPWPQYFEPAGWENKFGKQFGIEQIPTMWLLDKSGKLRDIDATEELEQKVQKMLAETPAAM